MSRNPINEEIYNLGSQLRKGMDSLTISDPGRLRVPFGSNKTPKKQSWMTVSSNTLNTGLSAQSQLQNLQCTEGMCDVVMDIPKRQIPPPEPVTECYCEAPGWLLAVGYSISGLGLALCNLLAPQHASKVCSAVSPIPLLCLLLQALTCMDLGHACSNKEQKGGLWMLGPGGLVLSACALPSACIFWTLQLAIPLVFVLSLAAFKCMHHRDVLAWVCISGACLGLVLALPVPVLQILEPRWGMTVAVFFSCILCFLAGLGSGGVGFQIKLL